MQLNDKQLVHLHEQVELAQGYEQFAKSKVGMDFYEQLNRLFTEAQNEIVLESHQRVGQTSTDALRGRMQVLSQIYSHINTRLKDGYRASEKLAKQNT